jgi:endonuclease/exonuclease/phosphatase (EEP) superfamily protein YafD
MLLFVLACVPAPSRVDSVAGDDGSLLYASDWLGADAAGRRPGGLITDRATYVVGERILVSFHHAVGSETDWIGLYPADQVEHEGSTAWLYTTGTQQPGVVGKKGSVRFLPVNLPAGEWEARLFHDDGYDLTDRVAFAVTEPGEVTAPAPVGDLTVMTFNSWLDGTAVDDGVAKIADAVVACGPDVVAFQEGGAAFARQVADALALADTAWVDADVAHDADNVIVSQLPILDTSHVPGGGALLATLAAGSTTISFVGSHLDYTRYGPYRARKGATAIQIERTEADGRGAEADAIVAALDGLGAALVLGDHNAPSHLDWTAENVDQNFDLVVAWPTSIALADAGFVDAYRTVHPDPVADRGFTWTPGYPKTALNAHEVHDRIDFVYSRSGEVTLTPIASFVYAADPWPSDHRAVVASFAVGE